MSTAKYRWWSFVRQMVRDHLGLKQQLQDLHEQSVTAGYSGTGGGGGDSRKTEQTALRTLPSADDQKVYDAVTKAIQVFQHCPDGERRMKLIELMYWRKKPLPMAAAAYMLHISEPTAKRWHGAFIRTVGKCYGFEVDTSEPK